MHSKRMQAVKGFGPTPKAENLPCLPLNGGARQPSINLELHMKISRRTLLATAAISSAIPQAFAQGSTYPQRVVKLVVPGAAGAPLDVIARVMGQRFSLLTGQPFVVENRVGAGGSVGSKAVAQASPNGYTLLAGFSAPLVVNPHLHANIGYTKGDFASIGLMSAAPMVLLVPGASPIKTLDDLIARGKKPNAGFYASGGNGTTAHVCSAILNTAAGLTYGHVPYGGGPAQANALLAGEVAWSFVDAGNSKALLADGRARALAVSTKARSTLYPTVPSLYELGFKQFDLSVWHALLAPAKTPQAVVLQLNDWLTQALKDPSIQETIRRAGFEPATDSSIAFLDKLIDVESGLYENIIRSSGMKIE